MTLIHPFFEGSDAFTDRGTHLGQFFSAKEEQDDSEKNDQFGKMHSW
jgi:hypothetical protein